MFGDDLDHALHEQVVDCPSCHGHVAPHTLRDNGGGDELLLGHVVEAALVRVANALSEAFADLPNKCTQSAAAEG